MNGARPLNSNGAPTDSKKKQEKKVATFFGFSYRLFAPPGAFVLPIFIPPPNVNLAPLIAILAPLKLFVPPNLFRVDRTLSCARYSRFFGIKQSPLSGLCEPGLNHGPRHGLYQGHISCNICTRTFRPRAISQLVKLEYLESKRVAQLRTSSHQYNIEITGRHG